MAAIDERATPDNQSKEKRPHKFMWNFILQFLGLIWIAPVVAILALNFRGFIVGAGLGCGISGCDVNPYSTSQIQQIDEEDRNITGALQLADKALEIWFSIIVGSMLSTGSPQPRIEQHDRRKWVLRLFVLFVVVILVITNLMGPATAILLLPTLGWKTVTSGQTPQAFSQLISADPPSSSSGSEWLLYQCSDTQLASGGFSCSPSGTTLDLLFQNEVLNYARNPVGLVYGDISYTFDETNSGSAVYSPTEQAMEDMDNDYTAWIFSSYTTYAEASFESSFEDIALTQSDYNLMHNAQQTQRLRKAPGFYTLSTCYSNTTSVVNAGSDKVVRCYDIPNIDDTWSLYWASPPNSSDLFATRCIREGSGWPSGSNNQSSFSVETGNSSSPRLNVNVYSSYRAVFLNTSTHACTNVNSSTANCDWDALFADDPDPLLRNISINTQLTEYSMEGYVTAYCLTSTYLRFPTYSLDTSPTSNPQSLVTMLDPDLSNTDAQAADPIIVNPD